MKLRFSTIYAWVAVGGIVGYPLVVAISTTLHLPNSQISIGMRLLIALGAVLLLVAPTSRGTGLSRRDPETILLFFFWVVYFCRLAYSTLFEAAVLSKSPFYYWSFALGTCFLPMAALAVMRHRPDGSRLLAWIVGFGALALVVALANADSITGLGRLAYDDNRLALDSLNPISLGQLGVTVTLAAYMMLTRHPRGLLKFVLWGLILLGLYGMALANSRGPVLALVAALIVAQLARRRYLLVGGLVLTAFVFGSLLVENSTTVDQAFGTDILRRFEAATTGQDMSALSRVQSYRGAWHQFTDSLLIGDGLEERTTRYYPHNILLEALMATGVLGSMFVLPALIIIGVQGYRLIREGSSYGWVGLLYVQYLVAAQFSGALWEVYTFWTLAGMVAGLAATRRAIAQLRVPAPQDGSTLRTFSDQDGHSWLHRGNSNLENLS